jgi:hypothetical protein
LGGGVSSAGRNRAGQKFLITSLTPSAVKHLGDLGRTIEHRQTAFLSGPADRNSNGEQSSRTARRPAGSLAFYQFRDREILPVICPTCQIVFASSLVPATARLLCMGLFSIFWFATGQLGRNGRLVASPEEPDENVEDEPLRQFPRNKSMP